MSVSVCVHLQLSSSRSFDLPLALCALPPAVEAQRRSREHTSRCSCRREPLQTGRRGREATDQPGGEQHVAVWSSMSAQFVCFMGCGSMSRDGVLATGPQGRRAEGVEATIVTGQLTTLCSREQSCPGFACDTLSFVNEGKWFFRGWGLQVRI